MYSGGNTSVRVESTWPSLTNVGPSVRSLSRAKVAAAVLSSLVPLRAVPAGEKAVCLIAAKFGDVRLLDNLELGGEDA